MDDIYLDTMNLGTRPISITVMDCKSVTVNIGERSKIVRANIIKQKKKSNTNLITFARKYISRESRRPNIITGKRLSHGRVKNLKVTLSKLIEYSKETKIPNWNNLGMEFYFSFHKWMESKNYSVNYIGKNISNLKLIPNDAFDKKILTNTDFKSKRFKVYTEESEEIYLSILELELIINIDLSNMPGIYDTARDVFIIGAFTGLRVSDYKRLKPENLVMFSDIEMIKVATKKTGNEVIIPIHPHVKSVLIKRNGKLPPKVHENSINPIY